MFEPFFDRAEGIDSSVQTLEGFHHLLEERRQHRKKMENWLVYGKWVLWQQQVRYIWPWFRDLEMILPLPDVMPLRDLRYRTPRFNDLKLSQEHRQYLVENHRADDLIGAIRSGMFDPNYANLRTYKPVPANIQCPMCGAGWTSWNAEYYVIRDHHFGQKGDGSIWHQECNLANLAPSVEPTYRQFLEKSGFQIRNVQYEPNGHASYPHMPPWCSYETDVGKVRMGWLVSALHIDYRGTRFKGDLLPENENRTRRTKQSIEVNSEEIQLCLSRLRSHLTAV